MERRIEELEGRGGRESEGTDLKKGMRRDR